MTVLAESVVSLWRSSAVAFARDLWPENEWPRPEQVEMLEAASDPAVKRLACRAPRGTGKSRALAWLAWHWICTRPDSLALVVAPSWRVLNAGFLTELRHLAATSDRLRSIFPDFTMHATGVDGPRPRWRIACATSDEPHLLAGHHAPRVLVLIDESFGFGDTHLSSVMGTIGSAEEWRLCVFGRGGSRGGFFSRAFSSERRLWRTLSFSAENVAHLRDAFESERQRLGSDDAAFRQEWLAEFTDPETQMALFPSALLDAAVGRDPDAEEAGGLYTPNRPGGRVLGVDCARFGRDDSAACLTSGRVVQRLATFPKSDEMTLAGEIIRRARDWGARTVCIDQSGLGGGTFARVAEVLEFEDHASPVDDRVVLPFNAAWRAEGESDRIANRKTQVLLQIRDALMRGEIGLPNDERLLAELASLQLKVRSDGRVASIDPPKSPDYADALVIAWHARTVAPAIACLDGAVAFARGMI